jgi:hypothetical protein
VLPGWTGGGGAVAVALAVCVLAAAAWAQARQSGGAGVASVVSVVKSGPLAASTPRGFVGLSFEYSAVPAYTGGAGTANPVLVRLIRNLAPGQTPMLRIGGDSTDRTWWPVPGMARPGVVDYTLTHGWLHATATLARALKARLILGVNLAVDRPVLAATEARALLAGIGRRSIAALELGNEPDIYQVFPAYRSSRGRVVHVRGRGYDFSTFMRQYSAVRRALPRFSLAGPALGGLTWASNLGRFIAGQPAVGLVTVHLYPLLGRFAPPSSPRYPTIPHLLSDAASTGLARSAAPYAAMLRAHHLQLRVDELNSVTSGGRIGVSDTFASALWALDTLFAFDQAGVAGVNIHMFPGARYAPFSTAHTGGQWSASVLPEYYGLLMFNQAAPPGSRIMPVSTLPAGPVKVWATVARDKTIRVVLINDRASMQSVQLSAPPGGAGPAAVEQLLAPSLTATSGVTLGGQTFGSRTVTGIPVGSRQAETISSANGSYPITLPSASATMLTWRAPTTP